MGSSKGATVNYESEPVSNPATAQQVSFDTGTAVANQATARARRNGIASTYDSATRGTKLGA